MTDHDGTSGAGPSVPGTASVPGQRRSACRLPYFEPVTELDPASTSYAVLARLREIDRRLLFTRRDACALTPYVEEWLTRVPPGAVLMSLTLGLPQGPIHHPARLLMSRLVEAPMPGPASRRVLLEDDRPGPVRADDHNHSHDDSHGHHDRRCETRPLGGGDGDGPPDAHVAPAPARSHTRRLPFVNCPCCGCAVRGHVDMLCDMCLRARCDPEFHGGRSPGCPRAPMPLSPILHRPRRYPPRGLER